MAMDAASSFLRKSSATVPADRAFEKAGYWLALRQDKTKAFHLVANFILLIAYCLLPLLYI